MGGSDSSRLRSLIFLAFGVFGLDFALAIYQSTFTNFLVNDLNINAFQIGALESIREIPGLLSALILGSMLGFPLPSIAGAFLLIFSLGIGGVSTADSWIQVVSWCVIWSIGFHSWAPLSSSIALGLSERKKEGKRLGQMNSVSSIASMLAMASVAIFSSFFAMQYRLFFIRLAFSQSLEDWCPSGFLQQPKHSKRHVSSSSGDTPFITS